MAWTVKPVVVDANLFVALCTTLPYSDRSQALVQDWQENRVPMYAPLLWEYELASAFRKVVAVGILLIDEATAALAYCLEQGVECIHPDLALHQQALRWAGRLGQYAAYDAHYLALAERLGAEFWTADKRMTACARQEGLTWVHEVTA